MMWVDDKNLSEFSKINPGQRMLKTEYEAFSPATFYMASMFHNAARI